MKNDLKRAKELLAKKDIKGALDLLKSMSATIKGYISKCPGCGSDVAVIQKIDAEHSDCPKCGAAFGRKNIPSIMLKYTQGDKVSNENKTDKKEILKNLWELYRQGDADADAFSINHFELTGWLKKSLAVKLNLPLPGEDLKKSEDEKCEKCDMSKDMCKCMGKSDDEHLSKDDVLDALLQMYKAKEEGNRVNRHSISKFEATGEIDEDILKMVYRKAGKDFYALSKKEPVKQGKDALPADMEGKEDLEDQHTGPLKPVITKK